MGVVGFDDVSAAIVQQVNEALRPPGRGGPLDERARPHQQVSLLLVRVLARFLEEKIVRKRSGNFLHTPIVRA